MVAVNSLQKYLYICCSAYFRVFCSRLLKIWLPLLLLLLLSSVAVFQPYSLFVRFLSFFFLLLSSSLGSVPFTLRFVEFLISVAILVCAAIRELPVASFAECASIVLLIFACVTVCANVSNFSLLFI